MTPKIIVPAHGTGAPALLRAQTPVLDELPPLNADDARQGNDAVNAKGRPFQRGNRAGANRRPGLALLGTPVDNADPKYRRALRKAKALMVRRQGELAVQHGGKLGAGPSSMLCSAALALAASRVLYEVASVTLDPATFLQAARLADSARQQELTAVGLAERESEARPRSRDAAVADMRARILGGAK
jgi:hypothetical protein